MTASDDFIFDVQYNSIKKKNPLPAINFGRKASNFHLENAIKEDITLTSYKASSKDFSDLVDVELNSCNESTMDINPDTDEIENCCLLSLQRFKGLIIKRYHYLRQTYLMLLIQLFIPLFVFSIIILVDQFLRTSLSYDQPFELNYNILYKHKDALSFFQHNNQSTIAEQYIDNSKFYGIEIEEIDLNQNMNLIILDKIKEIGMNGYLKNLLVSATELPAEKYDELLNLIETLNLNVTDINDLNLDNLNLNLNGELLNVSRKNFDVWFNNEVLHSLPISINLLYESIFRYLNLYSSPSLDKNQSDALHIHTTNHPFPNQLHYMYHFKSIELRIPQTMWSLICSLSLPFLAAYYSVIPIQENG